MSRPPAIWVLLWVVLVALGLAVWEALKLPEEEPAQQSASQGQRQGSDAGKLAGDDVPVEIRPLLEHPRVDGLLHSLPAPQNPPQNLDAAARKQWLDELMGLIDEASYLDDETSLRMLIVELRNPDAAIAQSAYSSLMARKDKKALPYLEEMSALDLETENKKQINALITFLNSKSVFDRLRPLDP